jgi:hypothetical protein
VCCFRLDHHKVFHRFLLRLNMQFDLCFWFYQLCVKQGIPVLCCSGFDRWDDFLCNWFERDAGSSATGSNAMAGSSATAGRANSS